MHFQGDDFEHSWWSDVSEQLQSLEDGSNLDAGMSASSTSAMEGGGHQELWYSTTDASLSPFECEPVASYYSLLGSRQKWFLIAPVNLVKDSPRFSSSQEALTVVMKLNDEDGFLDNVVFHCQSLRCDRYGRSRRDWYNSRGHAQSAQAPSRANNSNKVYRLPSESSLRFENYEEHLYFL